MYATRELSLILVDLSSSVKVHRGSEQCSLSVPWKSVPTVSTLHQLIPRQCLFRGRVPHPTQLQVGEVHGPDTDDGRRDAEDVVAHRVAGPRAALLCTCNGVRRMLGLCMWCSARRPPREEAGGYLRSGIVMELGCVACSAVLAQRLLSDQLTGVWSGAVEPVQMLSSPNRYALENEV
jgi:hypothetical protein